MLKSWEQGYFSAEMQRDVIITDDFVWLSVSNTINSFDKMLGVPKCITPHMSAKQKHQLSSAACAGPHLSVFISISFISMVFLKSMNALVQKYQDSVGLDVVVFFFFLWKVQFVALFWAPLKCRHLKLKMF